MASLKAAHTGWVVAAMCLVIANATAGNAADKTAAGQTLLKVDWADPELEAFRRAPNLLAGPDTDKLRAVHLPVIAFSEVPQIVKNVVGPKAKLIEPRSVVIDPRSPYWYQITDTYDGVTISISAERRINHEVGAEFQIGERKSGAAATLGTAAHPAISILDGETEEGMEGVIVEYTVHKFPDIPYTVKVECVKKAKSQCKDIAVITKDEGLLRVISLGSGK